MTWLGGFSLDLKLGGRMLLKYPGLTIVGGLAMAFAICVGAVIFQVLSLFVHPTLPLPDGDRIVRVWNWDVQASRAEGRILYDFGVWRSGLTSISELGAWQDVARNLVVDAGDARPVQIAEITASGFRVAGATPLLGRVLREADEQPGAPEVAVIGHELWRTRFGSDPQVLGRTIQLGDGHATVVGVMRESFAFPIAHDLWTPLRPGPAASAPRSGPSISVFAKLAPGASLETAQSELTTMGRRVALEQPATHAQLQPRITPYAQADADPSAEGLDMAASIYAFAVLLLVLICGNVALLLFARAATRETELAVRTALGASRARIVMQLFAEALVLGAVAAVVGIAAAQFALDRWGVNFLEQNLGRLPFWYDLDLSASTVLFALGLTMLGSTIAGVVPALKVTRRMGSSLKQGTAGAGGLQFGGIWTVVIVVQVAVTIAFPAMVYVEQWQIRRLQTFDAGFPTEEYLAARIQLDAPVADGPDATAVREAHIATFGHRLEELRRRVAAEPGVAGVTFVDRLPRTARPERDVEFPDDPAVTGRSAAAGDASAPFREATVSGVDPSYFTVLDAPMLAGRSFSPADLAPGATAVIVDQGFVDQILEGRNPIGQQLRFASRDGASNPNPWMEIVGVVKELGMGAPTRKGRAAGLYLPARPERLTQVQMMLHVHGDPMALAPQVREIATAVDPLLRVSNIQRVSEVTDGILWVVRLWMRVTIVMSAVALLLSLSGIYSVLSFIVARRTREIGVRVALGASRPRVVAAIFRRPFIQVGLGALAGTALIALAATLATELPGLDGNLTPLQFASILGYGTVMLGVCLLACIVPTRRALRVEPTVALRMD